MAQNTAVAFPDLPAERPWSAGREPRIGPTPRRGFERQSSAQGIEAEILFRGARRPRKRLERKARSRPTGDGYAPRELTFFKAKFEIVTIGETICY